MIELVVILAVAALTYLLLQILGSRPDHIFVSIKEREKWSRMLSGHFGSFLYISNVVATLTSLATVYVFFIGTTKLFGYYIFASIFSVILAGIFTLKITKKLILTDLFSRRLDNQEATTAAVTSLFWSEETRNVSMTLKIITQGAIICILWLEFATLSKLFSGLLGFDSIESQSLVMFISTLLVFDFTFRNGLRGFLFADILHFPLILFGTVALLIGALVYVFNGGGVNFITFSYEPQIPSWWGIVFVIATLFLNSFLLLTSESHWLRVWAMRDKVRAATTMSLATTAGVWMLLIIVGFLVTGITTNFGWEAVIDIVKALKNYSIFFSIAFWVAAIAAIFSTADSQAYSFLVLSAFNVKTGNLDQRPKAIERPFSTALFMAICFSFILYGVEWSKFPFEPIVMFIFPIFLCTVPAFVELVKTGNVHATPMIISVGMYMVCGVGMLIFPQYSFPLSLSAPLMPAIVSIFILGMSHGNFQKNVRM